MKNWREGESSAYIGHNKQTSAKTWSWPLDAIELRTNVQKYVCGEMGEFYVYYHNWRSGGVYEVLSAYSSAEITKTDKK